MCASCVDLHMLCACADVRRMQFSGLLSAQLVVLEGLVDGIQSMQVGLSVFFHSKDLT